MLQDKPNDYTYYNIYKSLAHSYLEPLPIRELCGDFYLLGAGLRDCVVRCDIASVMHRALNILGAPFRYCERNSVAMLLFIDVRAILHKDTIACVLRDNERISLHDLHGDILNTLTRNEHTGKENDLRNLARLREAIFHQHLQRPATSAIDG